MSVKMVAIMSMFQARALKRISLLLLRQFLPLIKLPNSLLKTLNMASRIHLKLAYFLNQGNVSKSPEYGY